MRDNWRLAGIAVVLIVLLRIAIGWQFVYEGLWKLNTFSSAKPWTSAGYLRNAHGPLRTFYRRMTGDPDDLRWLDYDQVAASWDAYRDSFVAEHPDLTEAQKLRLSEILDGPAQFSAPLAKLPAGVKFTRALEKVISYDADNKRLVVDGKQHLLPKEKAELEHMAKAAKNDVSAGEPPQKSAPATGRSVSPSRSAGAANPAETQRFLKALDQVFRQSARLSFKDRLAVLLRIDPERVGIVFRDEKTKDVIERRKGKITEYKEMLDRYEDELPRARQAFELHHLDIQWGEIQKLRGELVNPVRALDTDFKQEARRLLTSEQLARGPVAELPNPQRRIDETTIGALIVLGCLLMLGLFSRAAAIAAAGMLLLFYLAMPPWPGYEDLAEMAGPEHSFIVNKNLIEVIALLAIAAMPTGQWFGFDRLVLRLVPRRLRRTGPVPSVPSTPPAPSTVSQ